MGLKGAPNLRACQGGPGSEAGTGGGNRSLRGGPFTQVYTVVGQVGHLRVFVLAHTGSHREAQAEALGLFMTAGI